MKRRLLTVCVFLLLGAIVNVAVAWGCGWLVLPRYVAAERILRADRFWPKGRLTLPVIAGTFEVSRYEGFGVTECCVTSLAIDGAEGYINLGDTGDGLSCITTRQNLLPYLWAFWRDRDPLLASPLRTDAGWPLRSVRGWGAGYPSDTRAQRHSVPLALDGEWALVGLRHVSGATLVRLLPLQPIWPGFAINTLFYAAILWGLFAAPFALRRRRRIKRGLCPKCAYPIGTSDVCTECGCGLPFPSR